MFGTLENLPGFGFISTIRNAQCDMIGELRELSHVLDSIQCSFNAAFKLHPRQLCSSTDGTKRENKAIRHRRAKQCFG